MSATNPTQYTSNLKPQLLRKSFSTYEWESLISLKKKFQIFTRFCKNVTKYKSLLSYKKGTNCYFSYTKYEKVMIWTFFQVRVQICTFSYAKVTSYNIFLQKSNDSHLFHTKK